MEATELRIGNWFDPYYGNIKQATLLDIISIDIAEREKEYQNVAKPIPLTEQWLIDFGCEKIDPSGWVTVGVTYWEKDGIVFYKNGNKYYIPIGEKTNKTGRHCIEFDKVHELQNIFALTGKELTLKSTVTI